MKKHHDSTGIPIFIGDIVKYRGDHHRIKAFGEETMPGCYAIYFVGSDIKADEWSVDRVQSKMPSIKLDGINYLIPEMPRNEQNNRFVEWATQSVMHNAEVLSFLQALKREHQEKVDCLPTDDRYVLQEELLDRLFKQVEIWENPKTKGKSCQAI